MSAARAHIAPRSPRCPVPVTREALAEVIAQLYDWIAGELDPDPHQIEAYLLPGGGHTQDELQAVARWAVLPRPIEADDFYLDEDGRLFQAPEDTDGLRHYRVRVEFIEELEIEGGAS